MITDLKNKYYRTRSSYYRMQRICFPSPAEMRLVQILGGKVYIIPWLKHPRTGFCFAWVASMGKVLREEHFKREVRCGKYFVDFGNDLAIALEVDGAAFHMDVVAEFDRESYLYSRGWRIKRISAVKLWNQPDAVQRDVLQFLYS